MKTLHRPTLRGKKSVNYQRSMKVGKEDNFILRARRMTLENEKADKKPSFSSNFKDSSNRVRFTSQQSRQQNNNYLQLPSNHRLNNQLYSFKTQDASKTYPVQFLDVQVAEATMLPACGTLKMLNGEDNVPKSPGTKKPINIVNSIQRDLIQPRTSEPSSRRTRNLVVDGVGNDGGYTINKPDDTSH